MRHSEYRPVTVTEVKRRPPCFTLPRL